MRSSVEPFHYRLSHPGFCALPGAHPGQMIGSGQLFKRHESLLASPDPRRLDLRASLLDPFNHYRVKVFQQHSRIEVLVIADLSASMSFGGERSKLRTVAEFLISAAQSVFESGDGFGFIGCGEGSDKRWLFPSGLRTGRVLELAESLANYKASKSRIDFREIEPYLPLRRSLIFLVSDFHFDLAAITHNDRLFGRHAIVPVVLWDKAEYDELPEWGLIKLRDAENRQTRTLLMRPALKRKIVEAFEERKRSLRRCFGSKGAEPLFIEGGYKASEVSNYFLRRAV